MSRLTPYKIVPMKRFYSIIVLFVFVILSCEGPVGDVGPSGLNSLIKIETEHSGQNCIIGTLIFVGFIFLFTHL